MSVITKDLGAATAYAYAVEKGYTGTEEEFAELMASYADVGQTAVDAKDAAVAAKTAAQTAATTATNKATEATTAATTATTKAGEASTSASTATSAKDTAVSASQVATSKASEAAQSATSANTAKAEALTAKTAAQAAQTAAETAQGLAEDAQAAAEEAAEQAEATLESYAKVDGSYDTLTAGNAEQLLSNLEQTDMVPYNYRTAGGSLEIGDREKLKKIVGGSLAVNQLVENGNFDGTTNWSASAASISASNNILTVTKDVDKGAGVGYVKQSGLKFTIGHKYFAAVDYKAASGDTITLFSNSNNCGMLQIDSIADENWHTVRKVFNCAAEPSVPAILWINTITTDSTRSVQFRNFNIFDLTQTFGTTIADYVYTLETATAGTGVAWLKAHFPKIFDSGYIPYNAGTLEHVSGVSAHKMTGFNQWDEEWEVGTINSSNGQNAVASDKIRSKNYTRIIDSMQYYVCLPDSVFNGNQLYVALYGTDKNFIRASIFNTANGFAERILTPFFLRGASYLRFWFGVEYGTTYNHDICINLHWDGERDGDYEPYEEHSYPLDSDVTLRGIYKLDANNQLYADGDEYSADGTVTRRYGIVDLGTLTWAAASKYGNVYRSYANLPDAVNGSRSIGQQAPIILSTSAFKNSYDVTDAAQVATAGLIGINYSNVYVTFAESMTAAQIKTALSGVYMLYTLKNAYITTESADPYTEVQNVSNWGTEEFVSECLVPVGHETAYQPDLRAKIEVAPESPDTDGMYLMKRDNGQNSYVAYLGELPSDPTTDGTYTLKCTVASGTATKTWEADT